MSSKFSKFLEENQIDSRRLLVASVAIERLKRADRLAKAAAKSKPKKGDEEAKASEGEASAPAAEPRSLPTGRPVTRELLVRATAGAKIPSRAKSRLLRAVNRVLVQKKQGEVELKALF